MRTYFTAMAIGAAVLGSLAMAGCGSSTASAPVSTQAKSPAASVQRTSNPAPAPSSSISAGPVAIALKVVTGGMIGKPGWPEFQPSTLNLTKGEVVDLTITNYDDGSAALPANSPYLTPSGLQGQETVDGTPISSVAANQIAHTFTVPGLGINIPIPVAPKGKSDTIAVQFVATKDGTFNWQCMAPCGSGQSGWGGPMATPGYMQGTVTVTG